MRYMHAYFSQTMHDSPKGKRTVRLSPSKVVSDFSRPGIEYEPAIEGWRVLKRRFREVFSPMEDVCGSEVRC